MNFAGIFGYILAIAVIAFSIITSVKEPKIFSDVHGIVLVIGGTISVGLMTFNFKRLAGAIGVLIRKTFGGGRNYSTTIKQIVNVANAYKTDPKSITQLLSKDAHPFLKEAVGLISDYGFQPDEMDAILSNSIKGKKKRDSDENKVWHTVSRFPPAFGLLGATLGMISFLQTMGEPGSQERIGPAMATALVATFMGLTLANFVLIPLAERLMEVSNDDLTLRNIIKDGVVMILEKRHPRFIEEFLKSYISPSDRKTEKNSSAKA